jgi:NTE family protein
MGKNVALVLSSGGARGFAHIGVINMLERYGYKITSVAGTSMGALVGGIYATGELKDLEDWVCSLDVMEVLKLTDISISKSGLVRGKKVIDKMKELVPDRNIENLSIPFCAVATDIINGKEKIFTEGNLYDAIRSSISIPNVFQPFQIGENFYVDGGVVNPIPVNRVKRTDNDLLFVVDVNAPVLPIREEQKPEEISDRKFLKKLKLFNKKLDKTIPEHPKDKIGMFNLTNRSVSLMLSRISTLTMEKCDADLVINISRDSFGTYDFYKAKEIIEEGAKAAEIAIKDFRKL